MTRFGLNVERTKPKEQPEELSLADQLLGELKDRLPSDACCFATARDAPGIVICHQGRALGIQVKDRTAVGGAGGQLQPPAHRGHAHRDGARSPRGAGADRAKWAWC